MHQGTAQLSKNDISLAVLSLALGGFAIGTNEFAIMGLLENMSRELGIGTADAGFIIAAYALGVVVGAPILSAVSATRPYKSTLIVLMGSYALLCLLGFLVSSHYPALLVTRFLSGLPHGAFFGIAGLVASSLVPATRRAWAISMVMMGLSVAGLIGVPVVTWVGQQTGWSTMLLIVAALASLCVAGIMKFVPFEPAHPEASMAKELSGLKNLQIWLAFAIGAIGFGGFFAVYTYVAPTMINITGLPEAVLALVTAIYGVGMVTGNYLGGRFADISVSKSIVGILSATVVVLVLYFFLAPYPATALPLIFVIGAVGSSLVPALQTRLLDSAPQAPSLSASLNHSALNIGNFMGAFMGGLVIAAGWGLGAPALVGAALAFAGVLIAVVSISLPMPHAQGQAQEITQQRAN